MRAAWLQTNKLCREMQAFLAGYALMSICEIFSIGEFPLNSSVRLVSRQSINSADKVILETNSR